MAIPEDRSAGLKLAFEQAQRTVEEQAKALENLRSRAALVLSAAGVVASLLGSRFLDQPAHQVAIAGWLTGSIGGAAFAAVILGTVMVWWPATIHVNHDPNLILSGYIDPDPPATIDEIHHWLAYHRREDIAANRKLLSDRTNWFLVALAAFPLEVIALFAALIDASR